MRKYLTKYEAIEAMKNGKVVSHIYFDETEWMKIEGCHLVFEDGCHCTLDDFFFDRKSIEWENNYYVKFKDSLEKV